MNRLRGACEGTPEPLRHRRPCVPCRRRPSTLLQAWSTGASGCPSVVRGPSHWRRESAGPPFSRLSLPGEHLTHQPLLGPLRRPKPRPTTHSPLTKFFLGASAWGSKLGDSRRRADAVENSFHRTFQRWKSRPAPRAPSRGAPAARGPGISPPARGRGGQPLALPSSPTPYGSSS